MSRRLYLAMKKKIIQSEDQCPTCEYQESRSWGHCYMWKVKPNHPCLTYVRKQVST